MKPADRIWNRAAMDGGGTNPAAGDRELAALLNAHGLIMNGGVLHAAELLSRNELQNAESGYRFFGFAGAAELLSRSRTLIESGDDLDSVEGSLNAQYMALAPEETIEEQFRQHLQLNPADFAPP